MKLRHLIKTQRVLLGRFSAYLRGSHAGFRCALVLFVTACSAAGARANYTFTTLDDPDGAPGSTMLSGIDGDTMVGMYRVAGSGSRGFIYSGGVFTTLTFPGSFTTFTAGISNGVVAGSYLGSDGQRHGYLYSAGTYTSFDVPGGVIDFVSGISGGNIGGTYSDAQGFHGFVYNGVTFKTIDGPPGTTSPTIVGISGNLLLGQCEATPGHALNFVYNGSTYSTFAAPPGADPYEPTAISDNTILAYYNDGSTYRGSIYDGTSFSTLDVPPIPGTPSMATFPMAISGTTIVGYYEDGTTHGFIATVPEPLKGLAGLWAISLLVRPRRPG